MHPFFGVVARTGLIESRVAQAMGYHRLHYYKVKGGIVPLTRKFARCGVQALDLLGIRKQDGSRYTLEELFVLPSSSLDRDVSSLVTSGEEVA